MKLMILPQDKIEFSYFFATGSFFLIGLFLLANWALMSLVWFAFSFWIYRQVKKNQVGFRTTFLLLITFLYPTIATLLKILIVYNVVEYFLRIIYDLESCAYYPDTIRDLFMNIAGSSLVVLVMSMKIKKFN